MMMMMMMMMMMSMSRKDPCMVYLPTVALKIHQMQDIQFYIYCIYWVSSPKNGGGVAHLVSPGATPERHIAMSKEVPPIPASLNEAGKGYPAGIHHVFFD